jgi:hypothetical protein
LTEEPQEFSHAFPVLKHSEIPRYS